jgi:hypothetical protein
MIAKLDDLVSAARIVPGNKVPRTVHNLKSLEKVLIGQAAFLPFPATELGTGEGS